MLLQLLVISSSVAAVDSTRCVLCDSFQGYCDLEGSVCVGSFCASRIATLEQGLVRVQKLCVPADTPLGCRSAILWRGIQGRECVCNGDLCNTSSFGKIYTVIVFIVVLLI